VSQKFMALCASRQARSDALFFLREVSRRHLLQLFFKAKS